MRCACSIEPEKTATLCVSMKRSPPVPKSAEVIKAEIDAAIAATAERDALGARVTDLEAAIVLLKSAEGGV